MNRVVIATCVFVAFSGCGASVEQPNALLDAPTETPVSVSRPISAEVNSPSQPTTVSPAVTAESVPGRDLLIAFDKLKFKLGDGENAYSLKPMPDGAKLVDANERELARYQLSDRKLKVKDEQDQVLGYVVCSDPHFHIEDAKQARRLWKLQAQDDGDWMLEKLGERVVRVKRRDYGYELETETKKSLHKIKVKNGKTSLRDANDNTVLYTKGRINALAMACLGFDGIADRRIRVGLAVAVQLQEGE